MNKIKKVLWNEIKDQVKTVNIELFNILEEVISNDTIFFLAHYDFGEHFGIKNHAYLPDNSGKMVPIDEKYLNTELMYHLGYGKDSLPLGMILDKYCEWHYINKDGRIFPHCVQGPGAIFNIQILFDEAKTVANNVLSVSSGALASFLLPSIGCNRKHTRIQKCLNISIPAPKTPYEHYKIFMEILKNQDRKTDWQSQILYFPKQLIDEVKNNEKWLKIKLYFSETLRKKLSNNSNDFSYNNLFSSVHKINRFRPTPFIMDTAKYIFSICMGSGIGVKPAIDEQYFPVSNIQSIYCEYYGLEQTPTIIVPSTFDKNSDNVYYPLQCPFSKINTFKANQSKSTLTELETLRNILLIYQNEFLDPNGDSFGSPLYEACQTTSFSFYHYQASGEQSINSPLELPEIDPGFLFKCINNETFFPSDAKLFRGCVKLSRNKIL